jgi:glycosyltransferase involved in cell wall biosynthesis
MARVAINGRFSGVREPTGTQFVSRQLVEHIVAADRKLELVLMIDPTHEDAERWASRPGVEIAPVHFRRMNRIQAQLYEQTRMIDTARRHGCALIHDPMNSCPRFPRGMPQVVTVHDLNFHHNPQWYGRAFRTWLEWTMIPGLTKAARVVCISDYVLEDVHRTLGVDRQRLRRVYNGLRAFPTPRREVPATPPVVLAVNPWQPHKNLPRLIRAMELVRARVDGATLELVGRPHANFSAQPELESLVALPWVKTLGYLSDAELADAYTRASALCLPSLEEGFGLPLIEAMHFGVPVASSNATCLPEIVGDVGTLFDPTDESAIAAALVALLTEDEAARTQRVRRGRDRLGRFDWDAAARAYLDIYREVLLETSSGRGDAP